MNVPAGRIGARTSEPDREEVLGLMELFITGAGNSDPHTACLESIIKTCSARCVHILLETVLRARAN